MNHLISIYLYILISIQRNIDHLWRFITGLPQLKHSEITPELYLGGQYGIHGIALMEKLGITGIINLRTVQIENEIIKKTFRLLHLPTPDHHAPTIKQLKAGITFIQKEVERGGKVYIHCKHGEGRGPTMAMAYLISIGMTFKDAFALVKKIRTFIRPTPAQIERLQDLEKLLSLHR
jgi:protein-tyrosine phosphatase